MITIKALSKIFRNPFYKGIIFSDSFDVEVKGKHKAMVSEITFAKAQKILKDNNESNKRIGKIDRNEDFGLSKTLHCYSCGNLLSGCYSKGKNKYYGYYQCGNSKCEDRQYLPRKKTEQKFLEFLDHIRPPDDDLVVFKEVVVDSYETSFEDAVEANKKLEEEIQELESKLNGLKDYLEEGIYTMEEYKQRKAKYNNEILAKQQPLSETKIDIPEFETCMNNARRFIEHLPTFWINLNCQGKIALNNLLFPKGLIWTGKEYRTPAIHPVFKQIEEVVTMSQGNMTPRGIEPRLQD